MEHESLIDKFTDILRIWNKRINLVQEGTMPDVVQRHIADSLQLKDLIPPSALVIDAGSGAGFPGIVLNISGLHGVVLCEKSFKKCTFLREVKSKLGLDCEIYNGDVEKYKVPDDKKDKAILVSRAFTSLVNLLSLMEKLGVRTGLFHKGQSYLEEIEQAKGIFNFDYSETESRTCKDSVILKIANVRRRQWQQ